MSAPETSAPGNEDSADSSTYRQLRFRRPPGACELLLVRHGESAPAREGDPFPLVNGHGDPPLDPVGHDQAERVAARLAHEPITAIYVSNLRRTAETAAPLAARLGLEPRIDPDLREVYLGEWEGGSFRKYVVEGHPVAQRMYAEQRWDVIPGAEPGEAFATRVRGAIERIAAAHPDETVAVVTHGGVIGQVLAEAGGARAFAFTGSDNAAVSQVVVTDERWVIRRYNDTAHLGLAFTTAPEPLT
ncbi:MAG TPA: histidine phosphatase family protein [Acidimicrobiales bacterium]|nr:histidine phosphatase family protein [Acidimicrobiales bacterium]